MKLCKHCAAKPADPYQRGYCSADCRFWGRVVKRDDGCWVFGAGKQSANYASHYAVLFVNGQRYYAHRYSYETLVGAIPADLEIDHLCRNRRCVNPAHLEVVTRLVNNLRAVPYKLLSQCRRGHPYSGHNLKMEGGLRRCRQCKNESTNACHRRKRAELRQLATAEADQ